MNEKLEQWQAPITVLSPESGARPAVIPLKTGKGLTLDNVWERIHRAAVLGVCEAYKIDPRDVQHVANRSVTVPMDQIRTPLLSQPFINGRYEGDFIAEPAKRKWRFW
jgi:hypothetical protein